MWTVMTVAVLAAATVAITKMEETWLEVTTKAHGAYNEGEVTSYQVTSQIRLFS